MLHDGTDYRLYFFKSGSSDTIYQFAFDRRVEQYRFGYNSIKGAADCRRAAGRRFQQLLHAP